MHLMLWHRKAAWIFSAYWWKRGLKAMLLGLLVKNWGCHHATLSFHLDKLRQAGLIENQKQGRATIYTANYDVLVGSIRYLTDNCCKESDMDCRIEIKQKKECC